MNGHFVVKCVGCGTVIRQCSCSDKIKTEEPGACGDCRIKWIMLKPVPDALNQYLAQVHPNENGTEN